MNDRANFSRPAALEHVHRQARSVPLFADAGLGRAGDSRYGTHIMLERADGYPRPTDK